MIVKGHKKEVSTVEDREIVALFWERNDAALTEAERKYGAYCYAVARNIVGNDEDAKECVNDVWMAAWRSIPPHQPTVLQAFLGKLARNISLKKWRDRRAAKRGGGELSLVYEELADCIPAHSTVEQEIETAALSQCVNRFLDSLPPVEQAVFLRRYWYFDSIKVIAGRFHFTQAKVKSMLHRTRQKLAAVLQKEGFPVE